MNRPMGRRPAAPAVDAHAPARANLFVSPPPMTVGKWSRDPRRNDGTRLPRCLGPEYLAYSVLISIGWTVPMSDREPGCPSRDPEPAPATAPGSHTIGSSLGKAVSTRIAGVIRRWER